jgi:hypothetical protein
MRKSGGVIELSTVVFLVVTIVAFPQFLVVFASTATPMPFAPWSYIDMHEGFTAIGANTTAARK